MITSIAILVLYVILYKIGEHKVYWADKVEMWGGGNGYRNYFVPFDRHPYIFQRAFLVLLPILPLSLLFSKRKIVDTVLEMICEANEKKLGATFGGEKIVCSTNGKAIGVLVDHNLHILKASRSRYRLVTQGLGYTYCCQCGHDCGSRITKDVVDIVKKAKQLGAKKVVIRYPAKTEIEGVATEDVSLHVGSVNSTMLISL